MRSRVSHAGSFEFGGGGHVGHEAIISGRIVGASWRVGERFTWTHDLNREALAAVPEDDDWPWVVRGIFAFPAPYPEGTYRRQVIHFGLSIKDDPTDPGHLGRVAGQVRGGAAAALLVVGAGPDRHRVRAAAGVRVVPTEAARGRLYDDPPQPVGEWYVRCGSRSKGTSILSDLYVER